MLNDLMSMGDFNVKFQCQKKDQVLTDEDVAAMSHISQ